MSAADDSIRIEIIHAQAHDAMRLLLELPIGSTVADALANPRTLARWPEAAGAVAGVFGQRCEPGRVLRDNDRIELYRPLLADPKAARRDRAARR